MSVQAAAGWMSVRAAAGWMSVQPAFEWGVSATKYRIAMVSHHVN